jgi:23S rRNA pseudouridine1911/1915/1917 synthase
MLSNGRRGGVAAGHPPGNHGGNDAKTDNDNDSHDNNKDGQRAHRPASTSAADRGPAMMAEPGAGDVARVRTEHADDGQRLDRALARHLPGLSRSRLKRLIEEGRVSQQGTLACDPAQRVRPGQDFVVVVPAPEPAQPAAQPLPLDIAFEDAHIIVVDKPAGLVVHPAPGNPDGTLVNALIAHCGETLIGIGGVRRPGIVHRLDKDTSGLMVAAKTEAAYQSLARDFAARRIDRAYSAFVWGVPQPGIGEISGNIGRSPANRKKMAVVAEGRGRPAMTRYRVERAFNTAAALLECRLATGRTHQIRVHLTHIGHPLIGDPVYGTRAGRALASSTETGGRIAQFPRQALHARRLGLIHPADGRSMVFDSSLPADLHELFTDLEAF